MSYFCSFLYSSVFFIALAASVEASILPSMLNKKLVRASGFTQEAQAIFVELLQSNAEHEKIFLAAQKMFSPWKTIEICPLKSNRGYFKINEHRYVANSEFSTQRVLAINGVDKSQVRYIDRKERGYLSEILVANIPTICLPEGASLGWAYVVFIHQLVHLQQYKPFSQFGQIEKLPTLADYAYEEFNREGGEREILEVEERAINWMREYIDLSEETPFSEEQYLKDEELKFKALIIEYYNHIVRSYYTLSNLIQQKVEEIKTLEDNIKASEKLRKNYQVTIDFYQSKVLKWLPIVKKKIENLNTNLKKTEVIENEMKERLVRNRENIPQMGDERDSYYNQIKDLREYYHDYINE